MKKIVLVDGNNLIFRSYYATAYSGHLMKNSKGEPTNALYGFVTMINKIIDNEKPIYMAVAFDIGKNFRHEKYEDYKKGRSETPQELLSQIPKAKTLLKAMGIKYYELENYEADDIIGTIAEFAHIDPQIDATIVSSDKDLLQLIDYDIDVKLLKQKDFIRYNEAAFIKDFGIKPIRVIDLKALSGDASDNIPGVKGIGEKTALKLLQEFDTIENLYENIDSIKGAVKDKLIQDKDKAFFSKELCTIYKEVPLDIKLNDMIYQGVTDELESIYNDLEFYSLLKTINKKTKVYNLNYEILNNRTDLDINSNFAYYLEASQENYHLASILGMGIYDGKKAYFIPAENIKDLFLKLKDFKKYTFDLKKNIVLLNDYQTNTVFDLMIGAYLLNYNIKDDLAVLMNNDNVDIPFYNEILKNKDLLEVSVTLKAKYIFENYDQCLKKLSMEGMDNLFYNIEFPLVTTLSRMEQNGIICQSEILKNMSEEVRIKLDNISKNIYNYAGTEFNIKSPKQLGSVLFDHLGLAQIKKGAKSYSTDASVLEKLKDTHPIINSILEYRNLAKLNSTYLQGLNNYILDDGKIHTIYKQTLTRTGRLSSTEPNLQNIPIRDEIDRKVRKAFIPENDIFMCADYSQIELRVLAHISEDKELKQAFIDDEDIHTKVASDIFEVPLADVSKSMRRTAKAVIFGIVYGISGFGLGENLNINPKDAKEFIDKYYKLYPGVKKYMDNIIAEAHLYGSVRTLFNRKRTIDEINNKNYMIRSAGERIALNTPIQGTSADIIKMAMNKIDELFISKKLKSKMILQVHDELVFDVVNSEKETVENIVQNTMENVVKLSVPIKVSISYGKNWYEA